VGGCEPEISVSVKGGRLCWRGAVVGRVWKELRRGRWMLIAEVVIWIAGLGIGQNAKPS